MTNPFPTLTASEEIQQRLATVRRDLMRQREDITQAEKQIERAKQHRDDLKKLANEYEDVLTALTSTKRY